MARSYSNTSKDMTLTVAVDTTATSLTVSDASGLPVTFPYNLAIDPDLSSVEIVEVTAAAGNTLTVTRGRQDTPGKPHTVGAVVIHAWTALDGQEAQDHFADTQDVHGVGATASVVGTTTTQTLTNKTISGASNTITDVDVPVADVVGDWPIDTRSTGNLDIVTRTTGSLPIDTRSTGSLPIDTRTTGNLPGSRLASPVTAAMTFSALTTVNQPSAGLGLVVNANATPAEAAMQVVGHQSHPALKLRRNNSTSTGALLRAETEGGAKLLEIERTGKVSSVSTVEATDFTLDGSPDRSVKTELDKLNGPPRLQTSGFVSATHGAYTTVNTTVIYNIGAFSYAAGVFQVPETAFYELSGRLVWDAFSGSNSGVVELTVNINTQRYNLSRFIQRGAEGTKADSWCWNTALVSGQNIFFEVWQNANGGAAVGVNIETTVKWTGKTP